MKADIMKGAVVTFVFCPGLRMAAEVAAGLGASNAVQNLGAGAGRRADDVQRRATPVRGHLAAAAGWVGGRADRLKHHFFGRDAKRETEPTIAVVGKEPVVAWAQRQAGSHLKASWPAPEIWK